ncbi:MAG TPA: DUF4388 domain-containing protein [Candidatus Saccharimonadales bacterium]|nr:DUF4388 domain-containing protein [Candidatus Saccharimonadales bacterium]
MSTRPAGHELSGDLGLLSLFDLCQTLSMNSVTGTLRLEGPLGRGYIHFENGRIINGLDERQREGERAVRGLFRWLEANFQFQSGPISANRVIEESTQSFLLDVAREQDEAGAGDSAADSRVEKLKSHDALRQAFARIAHEARHGAGGSRQEQATALLERLGSVPGAEMLLRPGRPSLVRQASGWVRLGAEALGEAQFDELLRLLSPPGAVLVSGQSALPRSPAGTPFRVVYGEDVSGAFLMVRSLHTAAPEPDRVDLPQGVDWPTLLSTPQVEVGGPRAAGKSLFLAVAARVACERGLTVAWGSAEPVARLFNLDLPLQYLPGSPITPEQFAQLAICLRADVVVWDSPAQNLPGVGQLARWGICTLAAAPGMGPEALRVNARSEPEGRVRLELAGPTRMAA